MGWSASSQGVPMGPLYILVLKPVCLKVVSTLYFALYLGMFFKMHIKCYKVNNLAVVWRVGCRGKSGSRDQFGGSNRKRREKGWWIRAEWEGRVEMEIKTEILEIEPTETADHMRGKCW